MAQIQEYTPQVQAPEGLGGVSPNTEFAGALGRGIEDLGASVANTSHVIEQRQAQEESTDVYAHIADQRAFWTNKLQQQTQDGSLDVNKFIEDFQNSTDDFGSQLQTTQGKQFFERQQARLKGSLMQTAAAGAAVVAAADTKIAWQSANAKDAQAITSDPSPQNFQAVYDSGLERIDQMVKTGGLPEKFRAKAVQEMGVEFAKANIRGLSDTNPDRAKELLKAGAFKDYLNSDQTHEMVGEVNAAINAKEVEGRRFDANLERLQKARGEKWGQDNLPKIADGSLSVKDVNNAVRSGQITWQEGEHFIDRIDQAARKPFKSNPSVFNNLSQRITNPDAEDRITSLEQIGRFQKEGGINTEDYIKLANVLKTAQSPEGKLEGRIKTQAYSQMKAAFQGSTFLPGKKDPIAESQYQAAQIDLEDRLTQGIKDGKTVKDMLNPKSKDYITENVIRANSKTPQELMELRLKNIKAKLPPQEGDTQEHDGATWKVIKGQWVKQ